MNVKNMWRLDVKRPVDDKGEWFGRARTQKCSRAASRHSTDSMEARSSGDGRRCGKPDDLGDVCGSFGAHTSRAIAMILTLAGNIGCCTAVFATIIVVLLPKATGGRRPIRLFTSVLRVYARRAVTSALLVRADCAHMPTRDLEAQHCR